MWPIITVNNYSAVVPVFASDGNRAAAVLGYPVYTMTGLSATTIFCPDLFIGRRVHLESSLPNVTGDYQLTGVIHTITSRTVGGPWNSNCTMTRLNDNGTTQ